jgi:hypothetical protein
LSQAPCQGNQPAGFSSDHEQGWLVGPSSCRVTVAGRQEIQAGICNGGKQLLVSMLVGVGSSTTRAGIEGGENGPVALLDDFVELRMIIADHHAERIGSWQYPCSRSAGRLAADPLAGRCALAWSLAE